MIQIFKIGGKLIENEKLFINFLKEFCKLKGNKILVHGGGNIASNIAKQLGITPSLIEGRRITNKKMLDIIIMTYAGLINKNIVAQLQFLGCNSLGLSGADCNIINSIKRFVKNIDYGYVGDLTKNSINYSILDFFIKNNIIPVICSLTHNCKGVLLNTNADTIASYIAISMSRIYKKVFLHYIFEKQGVFDKKNNTEILLNKINEKIFFNLKSKKIITDGMIPKLENGFKSLRYGVYRVTIGDHFGIINSKNSTILYL